ncbi:MAG: hypothetical protein ACT4PU_05335 [Planctomycetota bacterium]
MPAARRYLEFLPALFALLLAWSYGPGLDGPFLYDDLHAIVENENLSELSDLGRVLRSGEQETRPVYMLSLALNRAASGLEPRGYRFVNLALHLGCALLLMSIVRRVVAAHAAAHGAPWLAGVPELSALIFLLHPLATEGVAYVNSRSGLLAACFGLAGLRLMLAALDCEPSAPASRRRGLIAAAIVTTALAMGSKESAVVFPVLLALVLASRGGRRAVGTALRRPWALPALLACTLLVPLWFLLLRSPHRGTIGAEALPLLDHLLTQPRIWLASLRLFLWPDTLNLDRDLPLSRAFDAEVGLSLLLLLGLLAGALAVRRRAPTVTLGALWFCVALAPTNSLVPFRDYFAERHLYLPLAGLALVAASAGAGLAWWLRGHRVARMAWLALGLALLLGLALRTQARVKVLADPLRLWEDTVALSPHKARPRVNLGMYLAQAGRNEEAGEQLRLAVEIDPLDGRAQFNYGLWLRTQGRLDEAVAALRVAAEHAPSAAVQKALERTLARRQRQGAAEEQH